MSTTDTLDDRRFQLFEAARLSGFEAPWTVDYLARVGIWRPAIRDRAGRGRPRLWSFADLVVLDALRRLLAVGVSLGRLGESLDRHRDQLERISQSWLRDRYLVSDGETIFLIAELAGLGARFDETGLGFAFVVDLEHARAQVLGRIARADVKARRRAV